MKNYIYTKSSAIVAFDTENNNDFSTINSQYGNIDYMYLISEDGKFYLDKEKSYSVNKGDIVYVMYPIRYGKDDYEREVIIVSDEKLYDYYLRLQAKEKEQDCCCDCEVSCCKKICCNTCSDSEPEQEEPQTNAITEA